MYLHSQVPAAGSPTARTLSRGRSAFRSRLCTSAYSRRHAARVVPVRGRRVGYEVSAPRPCARPVDDPAAAWVQVRVPSARGAACTRGLRARRSVARAVRGVRGGASCPRTYGNAAGDVARDVAVDVVSEAPGWGANPRRSAPQAVRTARVGRRQVPYSRTCSRAVSEMWACGDGLGANGRCDRAWDVCAQGGGWCEDEERGAGVTAIACGDIPRLSPRTRELYTRLVVNGGTSGDGIHLHRPTSPQGPRPARRVRPTSARILAGSSALSGMVIPHGWESDGDLL
ncbi:hypothetical protein DFH09DRAFT_1286328 [Mycena vulgaris]|nr:hypothetical protein DFH09DRAFT_1286328 [Mycena vulgaris]